VPRPPRANKTFLVAATLLLILWIAALAAMAVFVGK
jgi:hypothetical protein